MNSGWRPRLAGRTPAGDLLFTTNHLSDEENTLWRQLGAGSDVLGIVGILPGAPVTMVFNDEEYIVLHYSAGVETKFAIYTIGGGLVNEITAPRSYESSLRREGNDLLYVPGVRVNPGDTPVRALNLNTGEDRAVIVDDLGAKGLHFLRIDDRLHFTFTNSERGTALYRYGGAPDGNEVVTDLYPYTNDFSLTGILPFDDRFFFWKRTVHSSLRQRTAPPSRRYR